jgi:hypothetical protein
MVKDIKKEISKLEEKIEELKSLDKKTKTLRTLDSYTMQEKIEKFNDLFKFADDILQSRLKGEWHEDNDDRYYAWQQIMDLLGENFHEVWDKLPDGTDR